MRKLNSLTTLLAVLFLLSACGPMDNIPTETRPIAVYLQAVNVFNSNLRTYLDTRMAMPAAVQAEWKVEIEPYIKITKEALDDWGALALDGLPSAIAKREYDKLFSQMLSLLIKYKIVEVK